MGAAARGGFNPCKGFGRFGTANKDFKLRNPEVSIPVRVLGVLEPRAFETIEIFSFQGAIAQIVIIIPLNYNFVFSCNPTHLTKPRSEYSFQSLRGSPRFPILRKAKWVKHFKPQK
jgi:hypothetical protein